MGQLQAALASLADEEDVKQTLSQLPQIVVLGGQVYTCTTYMWPSENFVCDRIRLQTRLNRLQTRLNRFCLL